MWNYLLKEKTLNIVLAVLIILNAIAKTGTALTLTITLNVLIARQMEAFIFWSLINISLWAAWILLLYLIAIQKEQAIRRMSAAIRNDVANRLANTGYEIFHKEDVGAYVSWFSNDVKLIEDSAFRSFYAILDAVFIAVFSLISLWNFHPLLLALTIFVSLFIVVIPNLKPLKNYIQKSVKQFSQENENFIANVTDILNGFDEFFSYNMQQRMINLIGDSSRRLNKAIMQNTKRQNRVTTLVLVINIISQLSVNLCTGVLIILGAVSAGAILSVGQFAGNIFNSLGSISGYLVSMNSTKSLFEKMKNIETSKDSGAAIAPIREISLEHVNYNYGNGSVFRRDIQMNFQAGGNYAIVGESGSGKSTLMNILAGKLLDYNGSIRIDGKELKELSGSSLREQVILINQKPYLFNTTIRDNILMGKEIDKEKLDRILETSDLASVIKNLPEGLDTPVIGNGSNLSGGQRQRITLARAMAFGHRVLILDEGTSALNEESAYKIEKNLLDNSELTIIMITHHLQKEISEGLTAIYKI